MSHDPSANRGVRAIQVDINGLSVVSDDIATHTKTTFRASSIYFIDHRYFITTSSSGSGRIINTNFAGFDFMGGVTRANAVTGLNTITDNLFCGVNARNQNLENVETTQGSGTLTSTTFRSYWRIQ
jgi:hypothetical protein